MTEKDLHVRVSTEEMKMLERYCKKTKRTKTDVIRELVRLLPDLGASNPVVRRGVSMHPDAESKIRAWDLLPPEPPKT